jgi:hypothetical protein
VNKEQKGGGARKASNPSAKASSTTHFENQSREIKPVTLRAGSAPSMRASHHRAQCEYRAR